ncbi:RNA polymerase sigma-70 factor (ECF subfamily) [Mucilaginibacter oryzae]|uniref:RNA polymerase sigma-70 factor (ECF subfamily) n=1 Tax=Mucilaginibacter oryzae TaxID=468058 RepID=A0A316HGV1_9SPHI|nr:sigma-70 family RNA polymerase sigma factor [Mucilaginibacter oryzae]PWK79607.1 RNA polymerase sigma-70 factor (ECF subfamily) [Mucilaginibacter oryzae]
MKLTEKSARLARFEDIYHHTFNKLKNTFLKLTHNEDQTNDLLQTAYVKLWEKLDDIEDQGDYSPILYVYTRNAFRDELRKKCRQEIAEAELGYMAAEATNPTDGTELKEYEGIVKQIIDKMPLKRQRVYRMFKEDGLSYKNIAQSLGISPKTVDNHLNEASKEIRRQVKMAYEVGHLSSLTMVLLVKLLNN